MTETRRPTGKCSECDELLYNPAAKTCGPVHRKRRQARIKRQRQDALAKANEAHSPAHHAAVRDEATIAKVAREVMKDELKPVVREAITEDVMRGVQRLVSLTPKMVELIERDMNGEDRDLAQKAYTLVARYTLGNQSILPKDEASAQPMQVVFNMPRPGDANSEALPVAIDVPDATELRQCMECGADKPVTDFEGPSERCTDCHEAKRAAVLERFG